MSSAPGTATVPSSAASPRLRSESCRVVAHLLPLARVAGEQHDRVADELGYRFRAGRREQRRELDDLVIGQALCGAVVDP